MGNPPAHRARKRLGQNFLHDRMVIAAIVQAIRPQRDDAVVEIGPGLGALTSPLLMQLDRLLAIELDRDLIARLQRLPDAARLTLVNADALRVDLADLVAEFNLSTPLRIIGNLPYNISSPLLFHLLTQRAHIADMHFMLQKEVVARIVAGPGTRTYGRLSVMLQSYFDVESLLDVPPSAFSPPPKVDSAVIRLVPKAASTTSDPTPTVPFKTLERVVKLAFATRRKTLRNNFRHTLDSATMAQINLDWSARPETLSVEAFNALGSACYKLGVIL